MIKQAATDQAPQRSSFRRLIVLGAIVEILVIGLLFGVAVRDEIKQRSTARELARAASSLILLSAQKDQFDRARLALRTYAGGGGSYNLGVFTQARPQIEATGTELQKFLPARLRPTARELTALQLEYLNRAAPRVERLLRDSGTVRAAALFNTRLYLSRLNAALEAAQEMRLALAKRQAGIDRQVARSQRYDLLLIMVAGLLVIGSGIGVLLWIRRQTMVPLEALATTSRQLGNGDLSARVGSGGGVEEIAQAAGAFNQMADEIERQMGRLHELSTARSRFVASVSHELRTPITALRGYLEVLAEGEAGELRPEQQRLVAAAERNARELSTLVDDLLALAQVRNEEFRLRSGPVDLSALLARLRTELSVLGAERGVEIVLDAAAGPLVVQGDGPRLRQAFGNLISNAVKYSRDGQVVTIRALAVDGQVAVSFIDQGIGIPHEDLSRITEPFFRSQTSEGIPGTGLGLAIAKEMIELHGGRLAIESELGSGSTFTAHLPVEEPVPEVTEPSAIEGARPFATTTDR